MATAQAQGARVVARESAIERFATENKLTGWNIFVAFAALAIGGLFGVLQILQYNGIDLYTPIKAILPGGYYQGLSLHGVLNVLVFTTFYIIGFLTFTLTRSLDRPLANRSLGWACFGIMVVGLLMAAVPLLTNQATVLFTFYPPLKASSFYYIGLTLVVVGTWFFTVNSWLTYNGWRRANPGVRTPLPAFMVLITITMWTICTAGIASEMLFLIIPWSFSTEAGIDAVLSRTLFWFTGHAIVYFWLLPAYISWYTLVPRQAGGRLFSDPMARVSFLLFLILSTPIGIHHQFTDPGIPEMWKLIHGFFTFAVFFPSLLTFFNVIASLENGGRTRGGKGWLGWIFALPWGEPSFSAQVLAMIIFAFGGAGGLINASYNVNLVVHNTAWISGHFHLTVGTAVTLSFMAITYWLVPHITGRQLWSRKLALAQGWTWFFGMILFSHFMHELGLKGMPRRTMVGGVLYMQPEWLPLLKITMVGGLILFLSAIFYYFNMVMTLTAGKREPTPPVQFSRAISGAKDAPAIFDRYSLWIGLALMMVLVNYGPTLYYLVTNGQFIITGRSPW